jgi:carbonic anhydrase
LDELLAGNRRFLTGQRLHPNQDADRRAELTHGQRPFAAVFGCSDSRLAAEIVFDRGLGDLFVVRSAGHIAGPEIVASLVYAVTVLKTPLIAVLGHDSCGAVGAAHSLSDIKHGDPALLPIIGRLAPVVAEARRSGVNSPDAVSELHVRRTVEHLRRHEAVVAAIDAGVCRVEGMFYHLAEGRVRVVDAP